MKTAKAAPAVGQYWRVRIAPRRTCLAKILRVRSSMVVPLGKAKKHICNHNV